MIVSAFFVLLAILGAGAYTDPKCAYLNCMREYRPGGAYCALGDPYALCQCHSGYNLATLLRCPYGQAFNEYLNRCAENTERVRNSCFYFFQRRGMGSNQQQFGGGMVPNQQYGRGVVPNQQYGRGVVPNQQQYGYGYGK
ncbi:uncharacterized protein LOC119765105 [Culex quinquefasciatus]|uniref:uncharacterized protein LOC119765105 n=1 Tax=Culex quinquefasciatus TaxID=7176 RepID=UPI0018E39DD1|nr:uncharacterized protein LOC119765105 [Culex quinquefasciatus]